MPTQLPRDVVAGGALGCVNDLGQFLWFLLVRLLLR